MLKSQGFVPIPDPTKLTTDAVALVKKELETVIDLKFQSIRELFDEKFKGVSTEFHMRDIALAAAFKAAEAAVQQQNASNTLAIDKSATSFTKQIDSLDEKINDLKERIAQIVSKNYATVGAYIVGAVGIIAIVVSVLRFHGT